jgi:beta-glucosidase
MGTRSHLPIVLASVASLASATGCHGSDSNDITFPSIGSSSAPSGKTGFRFGAASAATQIEDQNTTTDWYAWTNPSGLAKSPFVGNAVDGYTLALDDIQLLQAMHLDSYRMSIEWARVEPQQGVIDEAALQHYSDVIDALVAAGIRPNVTIHHFSNPVWVADPAVTNCNAGPSPTNLCGLDDPTGGPLIAQAMAKHAGLIAQRFGDRVDDWATLNEPVNYLLGAYGAGGQPPGHFDILDLSPTGKFMTALRNYLAAHALMYDAIKANDTIDADGDGVAASVGLTKEAAEWVAASDGMPSTDAIDETARQTMLWVYQYLFVDAILGGGLDTTLVSNGPLNEPHPEWKGKLDWLGVQYYFRSGVTGTPALLPVVNLTPCYANFGTNTACVPPLDPTFTVPVMGYEYDPAGLYPILMDFSTRWPSLPLMVTESGIATDTGARRAEVIVRSLEQIEKARAGGADVRGYYHWSIFDNFEWAKGFQPHFGLYSVDDTTYVRTPTLGATVFGQIAGARTVTGALRAQYGGTGALTPEGTADGGS